MIRPISFPLALLFLSVVLTSARPTLAGTRDTSTQRIYIESMCSYTLYKELCIKSLSTFPNIKSPDQLAQCALTVSLYRAKYTRSYMLRVARELKAIKAKEYQVVEDCLDQMNDGVGQLSQSIKELNRLGFQSNSVVTNEVSWHINNVETWVSAALTDAAICMDNFPGRNMSKLKATIKGKVLNVAQTASNALALFHRYAVSRYRRAASSTTTNNMP